MTKFGYAVRDLGASAVELLFDVWVALTEGLAKFLRFAKAEPESVAGLFVVALAVAGLVVAISQSV